MSKVWIAHTLDNLRYTETIVITENKDYLLNMIENVKDRTDGRTDGRTDVSDSLQAYLGNHVCLCVNGVRRLAYF